MTCLLEQCLLWVPWLLYGDAGSLIFDLFVVAVVFQTDGEETAPDSGL